MRLCHLPGVLAGVLYGAWSLHAHAGEPPKLEISSDHEALDFLKSLPREWSGSSAVDCKTYEEKNIDKLSPAFARSAAAFLRAFIAIHGNATITSAHRTAKEQACVCVGEKGPCAGKPRLVKNKKGRRIVKRGGTSRHQLGIALDVRPGTGSAEEFECLHEFAEFNPHFGVRFPLGKRDRPHMEFARPKGARVRIAGIASVREPAIPCAAMTMMLTDHGGG